jgi:hypothetical protein
MKAKQVPNGFYADVPDGILLLGFSSTSFFCVVEHQIDGSYAVVVHT